MRVSARARTLVLTGAALLFLSGAAFAQVRENGQTQPQHVICDSGCGSGGVGSSVDISSVSGNVIVGPNVPVACISGCSGGTTDADDASIATGQTTGLSLGLQQVYDGSVWRRFTIGTAGTASTQVLSVQGIASMTALKVDGSGVTQPVSGIFWQATQPVSGTFWQATQPVSHANFANLDAGLSTLLTTSAFQARINTLGQKTMANSTPVTLASDQSALAVTGTFWQATQPVSGTVTVTDGAGALNVIVDSGTISTITNVVHVDDNAGSLTVDGAVTANAGTNLNTSLLALEAGGNLAAIKTDVDKIPSQGQALAAASMPVVLPAAQITTLTPPAAITNFALETGGNLATIASRLPALGQTTMSGSQPVTMASDQSTLPTKILDGGGGGYGAQVSSLGALSMVCTTCVTGLIVPKLLPQGQAIKFRLVGSLGEPIGSENGAQKVYIANPSDPCVGPTVSSAAISQTANARIVGGQGARFVYICHYEVVGADAENLSVVEGTGTTCGTGTVAVIGGATAANGMNFAAGGGLVAGNGATWIARTAATNTDLCLFQSGAGRVAGVIKYAYQ